MFRDILWDAIVARYVRYARRHDQRTLSHGASLSYNRLVG